jgi:EAL domain-containing protein (putative c-di-GMP-specific phosphodiesterase class I)
MAVNVSARQLQEWSFVDEVREALDRHAMPVGTLTLEITESVLIDQSAAIRDRLVALKRTGVRLAIDDFGTGYSSLSYLQQFPVDVLKIDRTFTNLIEGPGAVPPLLEGLVFLGRQLGLELVAEGIEIGEQREQLQRLQCLLGQGFLWAPPLEVAAVDELLAPPTTALMLEQYVVVPGDSGGRSLVHPASVGQQAR